MRFQNGNMPETHPSSKKTGRKLQNTQAQAVICNHDLVEYVEAFINSNMNWWHIVAKPMKGGQVSLYRITSVIPKTWQMNLKTSLSPESSPALKYHRDCTRVFLSSTEKEMEGSVNSLPHNTLVEGTFVSKSANFLLNTLVMSRKGEDAT